MNPDDKKYLARYAAHMRTRQKRGEDLTEILLTELEYLAKMGPGQRRRSLHGIEEEVERLRSLHAKRGAQLEARARRVELESDMDRAMEMWREEHGSDKDV